MSVVDDLGKAMRDGFRRASDACWHTDFLRSGIPPVDYALGGGVGYGRVTELIGNWSSGKTMLLYKFLAENQKAGGISILAEAEGAFSPDFFAALGGDPNTLWLFPTDTVEQFFDMVFAVCDTRKKKPDAKPYAIGWDSIAATGTKHLLETDMETRDMSKANMMNQGVQKIRSILNETRIALISVNQTREKIGSLDSAVHTPGGKAWPFIASTRIHLMFDGGDKSSKIHSKDGSDEIGRWVVGKVIKNKLAPPFLEFSLPIFVQGGYWHPEGYSCSTVLGIDSYMSLFYSYLRGKIKTYDKQLVMTSSGAWYSLNERLAPGYKKFMKKDWLEVVKDNPWIWNLPYTKGATHDISKASAESAPVTSEVNNANGSGEASPS